MFMAVLFVKLDDIDCFFEKLKETKLEIEEEDKKIVQFIEYFEKTCINVNLIDLCGIFMINTHLEPIILVKLVIFI